MLNRILELALHNRLAVLVLAALLCGAGIYTAKNLNVDVFPDLSAPTVTLMTEAHGLESEEVEKLLTFPIETALNGAPMVRRLRSASAAGISIVWVEFDWGTDIYKARQIVAERMALIRAGLPDGIDEPSLAPISSLMGEIMLLGLHSDTHSPMDLRSLADWGIMPQLKALGGIANVVVMGGDYKQYEVVADPAKMQHYGILLSELETAIAEANVNSTGGFYSEYGKQYHIKGEGRVYRLEELERAFLKMVKGQPLVIGDVAKVEVGASDKIGDGSLNAAPAVLLTISKQPGVNTLALTESIDEALEDIKGSLAPGIEINDQVFRQADFIESSVSNLQQTLLEGAFFVVLVLFIFLMNWRTTLISLLAIPLSLLVTVIILKLMGYSINTMSLGGMAIAIGALVDDAIIDVENVYKRLRQNSTLALAQRKTVIEVVLQASMEIRSSIIIATLIIIVSFVPLFFLSGMEGRLLAPLGIAFITSVLTSLLVAITVTPVLCSYMLGRPKSLEKQQNGTPIERILQRSFSRVLSWALPRAKWLIGGTALSFILSLVLFFQLGRGFLPEFNEGSLVISLVGMPGMSLEESSKMGHQAEVLLLQMPQISVLTRRTGRAELDEHAQGVNSSEIDAPFTLQDGESRDQFLASVRENLAVLPGLNITIGQPIAHRIDHMLSGTRANIAIKVFGDDLSRMYGLAKQIETYALEVDGLVDVAVEHQVEVPQIQIKPRRAILSSYGLTTADLMHFIETAFAGMEVGQIFEGQRYFDLVLRYPKEKRQSEAALRNTLMELPNGQRIPLNTLAEITSWSSPNSISREDVQRKVVVSANVQGRDLRSAVEELQLSLKENIALPRGYRLAFGGQFESEAKASQLLSLSAGIAVLVIYLLLFFEFRQAKLAAIVLLNLPLALIGGILIVYFSSGTLSIAATIGFISLFGIATRNGILMISRYQDLAMRGLRGDELIIKGTLDRLNPIIMTALTTALALIPLALKGQEAGNEIQSPMAVVILGGLFSATLLNLLVIPGVYKLLSAKDV